MVSNCIRELNIQRLIILAACYVVAVATSALVGSIW